jgi:P4 family phage/plasmid primase-like protien
MTTNPSPETKLIKSAELVGMDALTWLAEHGAQFCKVAAWDAPGNSPGKRALGEGWQTKPYTLEQVLPHIKAGGNVGLLCGDLSGGICLLDLDEDFSGFTSYFPEMAKAPAIVRPGPDKGKVLVKIAGGTIPAGKKWKHELTDKHPFIEWLANGNQGVIPPSKHPDNGESYRLINPENGIKAMSCQSLSDMLAIWTGTGFEDNEPAAPPEPTISTPTPSNGDGLKEKVLAAWDPLKVFTHFGMAAKTRLESRGEWVRLFGNGGLFVHVTNGVYDTWALGGTKGAGGDTFDAWWYCQKGAYKAPRDRRFYELLKDMATAAGIPIPERTYQAPTTGPDLPPIPGEAQEVESLILLTELGNSRRFSKRFRAELLHDSARGWLVWTGKKWEVDENGRVVRLAKRVVDDLYSEAREVQGRSLAAIDAYQKLPEDAPAREREAIKKQKEQINELSDALMSWAHKSQTAQKIAAMLNLAESDLPARVEDFDSDPWLINCDNGVLDLRTGELLPHNPGQRITKIAGAAYDPGAACPLWLRFLDRVFDHKPELIEYIRRAVGYSLTGKTTEQCLLFLHGTGKNGKTVFSETIAGLLGDYARKTPTDTLMSRGYDEKIPNDLARLPGARVVLAAELAEGKRLNESLVKDLTGGDRITARFLRKEYFEFTPTFKIWMYGNHKPAIRGTDEGIWRRVRLIPFSVTIPDNEQDPNLTEKLKAELPGILAWAVSGCMAWQQGGLKAPAPVTKATNEYRAEQDLLAAFLETCCMIGPEYQVIAGELYTAYKAWAVENGESEKSQRWLSGALMERGLITKKLQAGTGKMIYKGLGLLAPAKEGPQV